MDSKGSERDTDAVTFITTNCTDPFIMMIIINFTTGDSF